MSTYIYKARDGSGVIKEGEIDGENVSVVKYALADQGLFPVSVQSKSVSINLGKLFHRRRRVEAKELIALTRQFAALFKAGVAMDRILNMLSRQTENEGLKDALKQIDKDVTAGKSLSEAFARHPQYFDELYVNMLAVGELGGVLDETLAKLTGVMKREHKIVSSVRSATLYPKIVIVAFIIVSVVMMIVVVPGFSDFYSGYGAKLPLPTRIMMGISDAIINYWYIVLGVVVAIFIAIKKYIATPTGQLKFDWLKFKIPVFGKLALMVANARYCHLVSTLYKSGLPLARALPVVGGTIGNKAFEKEVQAVHEDVEKGSGFAEAMEKREFFTPLVVETTAVGESAGALDEMMSETATFYDEEISDMLDRLTTLIEPLLLVGIFAMVALLAFAIFLPMWNVSNVILSPNQ